MPTGKHLAVMHEQSHKDEMRDALRGDFERLRARRGDAAVTVLPAEALCVVPEPPVEPVSASVTPPEPAPTAPRGFRLGRLLGRS